MRLDRQLRWALDPAVLITGPPPVPQMVPGWDVVPVSPVGPALELVASWMHRIHVARWWGQAWPADEWTEAIAAQLAGEHSRPWLVRRDGRPLAYIEVYRAARDVVGRAYPVLPHDLGIHVAIGTEADTGRGLGRALLRAVGDGLLAADPSCLQLVGDPAADHVIARRAFAGAGFDLVGEFDLPHKRAAILVRSRTNRV